MIISAGSPVPAARPRPATVTVAFVLQLALAAALLGFAVLTVVDAVVYDGLIDEAAKLTRADPDEVAAERAFGVQWAAMTGVPAVALLVLFAATAFPVRSGSNVARILACLGAGVPLLCGVVCGGLGAMAASLMLASGGPEQAAEDGFWPEDSAFYDRLYELEGTGSASWLGVILPALLAAVVMMSIAVAVLLLVPPSNRYYRRLEPPPPATPGYPFAYPVPPGYALVPLGAVTAPAATPQPVPPAAPAQPPAAEPAADDKPPAT